MEETVELEQKLPSYLQELVKEYAKCRIVFCKPIKSTPEFVKNDSLQLDKTAEENVDAILEKNMYDFIQEQNKEEKQKEIVDGLLEVDLDEGSIEVADRTPQKPCTISQSTDEEYHYPLKINFARTLLGNHYNNKMSEIPTFCIVKDDNSNKKEKPVILGGLSTGDYITSYLVSSIRVQQMESNLLKWDELKKQIRFHECTSVEYIFRRIYNICGSEIKDIDIEDHFAAMVLETCWTKPVEDEPNFIETRLNLKMQVVSGHPNSAINELWNELKHLEKYMEVLYDEKALQIGSTVISENHLPASDIAENIHYLCSNPIRRRNNSAMKLSLEDLRELTILDRLWCIFIHCKDLIDLKNCLSTFFRIAKIENLVDRDRAVELVKGLDIQDYMLNLSFAESLKFLIAIGFEKLKNDYLAIINFYNPIHQVGLEKLWSQYCVAKKQEVRRKSLAPNQPIYFALTDTTFNREKMNLLVNLHNASEYVVFMKNNLKESVKLSEGNFGKISNEAYVKFVFNNENIRSTEPLKPELVTITCELDSRNEELYKNLIPVKKIYETKFKMNNNKTNKDEVTYTMLVSKSPIFTNCIDEDTVVQSDGDLKISPELENNYYVAKLTKTHFGLY